MAGDDEARPRVGQIQSHHATAACRAAQMSLGCIMAVRMLAPVISNLHYSSLLSFCLGGKWDCGPSLKPHIYLKDPMIAGKKLLPDSVVIRECQSIGTRHDTGALVVAPMVLTPSIVRRRNCRRRRSHNRPNYNPRRPGYRPDPGRRPADSRHSAAHRQQHPASHPAPRPAEQDFGHRHNNC